jgi:hypothetical protein
MSGFTPHESLIRGRPSLISCRTHKLADAKGPYRPESRGDPYDTSMENLRKAFASKRYHPPRPWRSKEEALMIRRLVLWWHTCRDNSKPSGRAWARGLGISHVWLLKLVRKFQEDPAEVRRLLVYGDPRSAELDRAREYTRRMRDRGELRLSRREKWAKFFERYPGARELYPKAAPAAARREKSKA